MAAGEEKIGDFYTVLGLRKECSEAELRIAYKKLAMVCLQTQKYLLSPQFGRLVSESLLLERPER